MGCFCFCMVIYMIYGQTFPEHMSYMNCFRFWAGNWPMNWVLVSEAGKKKIYEAFPVHAKKQGPIGAMQLAFQGEVWAMNMFGLFQTAQLPHRIMPMAIHKAMKMSFGARGEQMQTLTEFQENGGLFSPGIFLFNWIGGFMLNDALRGKYMVAEMQKQCNFEEGEMMYVEATSFPA